MSMLAPMVADRIYRLPAPLDTSTLALTRILGGMMVANAVGLVWFARDPGRNPVLAPVLLIGAILGSVSAALPCVAGELQWSQMIGSLVSQTLLAMGMAMHLQKYGTRNQAGQDKLL